MKTFVLPPSLAPANPSEDEIRVYAYHLYENGGSQPGRDLDNWYEAASCLKVKHSPPGFPPAASARPN